MIIFFNDKRNDNGFTIVEIIVVLLLMSIIAATVLGRSINTQQLDVAGEADKIKNQIRYTQSMAMKRPDRTVWGMKYDSNTNEYWIFSGTDPDANLEELPDIGYDGGSLKIPLGDNDVEMVWSSGNTLFFDKLGKPYRSYTDDTTNEPVSDPGATLDISVQADDGSGDPRQWTITPETGLIQ